MNGDKGFSLVELLIASTILLFIMLAVLLAYSQGAYLGSYIESEVTIHENARVAMNYLDRQLRMIGFGVPQNDEIGGGLNWNPAIFWANSTSIGFRADVDQGNSRLTCTPKSSNTSCPQTMVLLESIQYFDDLSCDDPDSPGNDLPLIVVKDRKDWLGVTCSIVNTGDTSLTVTSVTDNTFTAGKSEVFTMEQVYYRYVAQTAPPYGYLERVVRYDNQPSVVFPPSTGTWVRVADHLASFDLEYQDATGTVLTGSPLSATDRAAVHKIVVTMEGFDEVGPNHPDRRISLRSEILVRNKAL